MFIQDDGDGSEPTSATQAQDPDLKHPRNSFVEKLATFMEEYGLLQEDLATLIDVDEKTINNWLTYRHTPSFSLGEQAEVKMADYAKTHAKQMSMSELLQKAGQSEHDLRVSVLISTIADMIQFIAKECNYTIAPSQVRMIGEAMTDLMFAELLKLASAQIK